MVWSHSHRLLNPIVCHYPHLSAIQISLKESRKECSQHQGIHSSVMCDSSRKLRGVQLFPLNTKDSGITSRLRHTSSWRKQPELSATSLTPCSHPPKPATAYPNYPTGIENSTGPCLMERLDVKYCIHNLEALKALDTELLWVQTVWSHRATVYLSFAKYASLKTASPLAPLII